MTEQMAIRELEDCIELPFGVSISDETCKMAIQSLEEIRQYRAIGTVEEINAKLEELERWHKSEINPKIKNVFANTSTSICHNCDHKDEYIEELEVEVEELQDLKEKSVAKKVKEIHTDEYYCPACGSENMCSDAKTVGHKYCPECGQALNA